MRSLERLLRPKTIAVFGGGPAAAVVAQCDRLGFAGEIWPVHPSKAEVGGRRAYRSVADLPGAPDRSEEHTSELQSLMRISYAVFCLKKKKHTNKHQQQIHCSNV